MYQPNFMPPKPSCLLRYHSEWDETSAQDAHSHPPRKHPASSELEAPRKKCKPPHRLRRRHTVTGNLFPASSASCFHPDNLSNEASLLGSSSTLLDSKQPQLLDPEQVFHPACPPQTPTLGDFPKDSLMFPTGAPLWKFGRKRKSSECILRRKFSESSSSALAENISFNNFDFDLQAFLSKKLKQCNLNNHSSD
eukprot:Sdes_comp15640_c0_seq1m4644